MVLLLLLLLMVDDGRVRRHTMLLLLMNVHLSILQLYKPIVGLFIVAVSMLSSLIRSRLNKNFYWHILSQGRALMELVLLDFFAYFGSHVLKVCWKRPTCIVLLLAKLSVPCEL